MSGNFSPAPPQNILMPPPVPSASMRGDFLPVFLAKFSATRVENGNTVEEPTAQIWSRAAWAWSATASRATVATAPMSLFMSSNPVSSGRNGSVPD
ncbi:hypothetical protein CCNA_03954 [Caulobacter vibrioides NA1000]|uniref:Uncharacterized protein n=1 Tax=Caulobacter vibrioides (strain NA1000 / CB15N) TaxID=565050 RepID=A0A0H3J451_CAUVN|nr:hypothetical protein [Caulobacter vibrioides]YP_009020526.1 hypothetical protein CCNA_03954 [Caulobacter vibrioides NA1000]AHI88557.1 hypothetical protein CCNA_03954 [Caulobacter vibrioides NA1000]